MRGFRRTAVALLLLVCAAGSGIAEPVDMVVMLDTSQSMLPYYEDIVDYLIQGILRDYLRFGDTFHLIPFAGDSRVEVIQDMGAAGDIEAVLRHVLLIHPLGQYTDLVRAFRFLHVYVQQLPEDSRKIILILTDGKHEPPPGSRYDVDADSVRSELFETARLIRRAGWEVRLLRLPSAEDVLGLGEALPSTPIPPSQEIPEQPERIAQAMETDEGAAPSAEEPPAGRPAAEQEPPRQEPAERARPGAESPREEAEPEAPTPEPAEPLPDAARPQREPEAQPGAPADRPPRPPTEGPAREDPAQPPPTGAAPPQEEPPTVPETPEPAEPVPPPQERGKPAPLTPGEAEAEEPEDRSSREGPGVPEEAPAEEETDRLEELSEELEAPLLDYDGEEKEDLANQALGVPQVVFPDHLGEVHRRFVAPFRIRNFRNEPITLTLTNVAWEGEDILRRPTTVTIPPEGERVMQARLLLPDDVSVGEKSIVVRLGFREDVRVAPSVGEVSFELTEAEPFRLSPALLRGIWITLLAILILAALLLFVFLVRRAGDRREKAARKAEKLPQVYYHEGKLRRPIELRVVNQNPNIGMRNIHTLRPGARLSVGGRGDAFLIFLVRVPGHIAELRFDGNVYTFVPVRQEFFPELEGPLPSCLGARIALLSNDGRRLTLYFREWVSPLEEVNRIMHLTDRPGTG